MPIDKKLLQETLAHYQVWNEQKFVSQVLERGQYTPQSKWRMYKDMFAFALLAKPESSWGEQILTAEEWENYFEKIKRFETHRHQFRKIA